MNADLQVKDLVDARDGSDRWVLGQVTAFLPDDMVEIHYVGWPETWKESFHKKSERLAPPYSCTGHVNGETGEEQGRARAEFVRKLQIGEFADCFDMELNQWQSAAVTDVNDDHTVIILTLVTGKSITVNIKQDYLDQPWTRSAKSMPGKSKSKSKKTKVATIPFKIHDYLDVKDGETWRLAQVIEIKEENIHFRFLGWTQTKWNVWLPYNCPLICSPPFTHVKEDTGHKASNTKHDCRVECMWKRAMIIGLGCAGISHRQIEGIDQLLQLCFMFQERLNRNQEVGVDIQHWVAALESGVEMRKQTLPAHTSITFVMEFMLDMIQSLKAVAAVN